MVARLPPLPDCSLTDSNATDLKQQRDEHKCSGVKNVVKLHIFFRRAKISVLWLA